MKFLIVAVMAFFSLNAFAYSDAPGLVKLVQDTCPRAVVEFDGTFGKEYDVLSPRFSFDEHRALAVVEDFSLRTIQMRMESTTGGKWERSIPLFDYKRILLIGDSIWFLQDAKLIEFNISSDRIVGEYPSYPAPLEVGLTTRARGFAHSRGQIYIAHGELGVVVFDVRLKKPVRVLNAGLRGGSLVGAVAVRGDTMYVLQGAYHPEGFNGLSVFNLVTGATKIIAYHPGMGVVDPYSSTMAANDDFLFVNNGGWIHAFKLTQLAGVQQATLEPTWISVVESIATEGGNFPKYLMVNGDLVINGRDVVACSSISYLPVGARRPVTEARSIYKPY